MFDPVQRIERICIERQIHPVHMIATIISTLGHNHRDSKRGRLFGVSLKEMNPPVSFESVHDEIDALCTVLDPPRDPELDPPASLLETLELALSIQERNDRAWAEQWRHEHGQHDPGAAGADVFLNAIQGFRQVLRETMNDLERLGMEQALDDEENQGA
jgi:hypothetical protein